MINLVIFCLFRILLFLHEIFTCSSPTDTMCYTYIYTTIVIKLFKEI
jgi:hypothetical protein